MSQARTLGGFTLVEMTIVLFILSLLIAGLVGPIETQLEARDRQQTVATMNTVIEALYGYAVTHGRLPCPDTDGDGLPNPVYDPLAPASADCNPDQGFLPWAELGVGQGDAWSNRFAYRVRNPHYTWPDQDGICNGSVNEFDLCTTGGLVIKTRGDDPATAGIIEGKSEITAADTVPAAVVSFGRNGRGATSTSGVVNPLPPAGTDEAGNTDSTPITNPLWARGYSRESAGCADDENEGTPLCAFDDLVQWLSAPILNHRMVTAGRLP